MRLLFTMTVFWSAFMLFVIEPIAVKLLLPAFGGSASVWTAAMVFFQVSLLGGYAYANLVSRCSGRWVAIIQICVIGLVVLSLSASPANRIHPTSADPLLVGLALARLLGLSFLVLSGTSPLLQRAFTRSNDPLRDRPYFLYAASNAGSLIALLSYPVIVEPLVGLRAQYAVWIFLAGLALLASALCLIRVASRRRNSSTVVNAEVLSGSRPEPALSWQQRIGWLCLAAAPSSLLLGVTTFLTTSVAPIPLLWVVPLSLYLVTFIIAFAHRRRISATGVGRWLPVLATPLSLALILESATPIIPLALFHLTVAFFAMLACHLRLGESRPGPRHLTEFFLWLAAGGAFGGLFNALIAPHLFTTIFEYPLALALCCMLAVIKTPDAGMVWDNKDWLWPIGIAAVTGGLIAIVFAAHMQPSTWRTLITIGIPAMACFVASGRPIRFGLSLLALFVVAAIAHVSADGRVLYSARSFYGVHRVVDDTKRHLRRLVHGNTVHGIQSTLAANGRDALTYYSRTGPAGSVFRAFHGPTMLPQVGLVGLGVGSLAAYGEPGQAMKFFEIDPVVIRVASDPRLFSFLTDSKATVTIVEGDGRLMLAPQPSHQFNMLVLDAFASDSIPVHLLTEEAIRMYLTKLEPHGLLLFHISNNYLDLAPVLAKEAQDLGLISRLDDDTIIGEEESDYGKEASRWMILSRHLDDLGRLNRDGNWIPVRPARKGWTDDASDILSAFKLP